jgi:hypothetical protein
MKLKGDGDAFLTSSKRINLYFTLVSQTHWEVVNELYMQIKKIHLISRDFKTLPKCHCKCSFLLEKVSAFGMP